jgi:phage gp29-like protein
MGFWSRLFGTPSAAVAADAKAVSGPADDPFPLTQAGADMWRSYPEERITPEYLRSIQKQADVGYTWELMELYDAIASDYHVASQLRTRKLSVAGAPVDFDPGDTSAAAEKIAEDARVFWQRVPNPTQLLVDVLDDFYRGFSCTRPIYDSINGKWCLVGHEAIDSRYFRFIDGIKPIITPVAGGGEGIDIPSGYIYSECRDKAGPIVRAGVGRSVSKLWVHKAYALVDTASYIERYGSPHVQAVTSRAFKDGDPVLERIKDAARSLIADQIGIVPEGAKLEFLDAVSKGSNVKDVYLAFMQFLEQGISKAIVGQVLTADAGPGGIGHGGASKEQGEVRQDIREADAARIGEVITCQVIRPWTLWHYGPNAPVPRFKLNVSKPEDKVQSTLAEKQRAETMNILRSAGLEIKKSQCYDEFDLERPVGAKDADVLPVPTPPTETTQTGDPGGTIAPGGKPAPAPAR